MKLTPEQIDRLYLFTSQHYVEYYDLQTELVDHLANAIEEQWQGNPNISFETALNIEFKKFGVCGFTDMVGPRKMALQKKYDTIVWGFIKAFFKLPLILGTFTLIGILPLLIARNKWGYTFVLFAIMIINLLYGIFIWGIRKTKKGKGDKKWLFEEVLQKHNPLGMGLIAYVFYSTNYRFGDKILEYVPFTVYSLIFSAFIVFYGLYLYIVNIVVPRKTKEYLKQTYPEYEISK